MAAKLTPVIVKFEEDATNRAILRAGWSELPVFDDKPYPSIVAAEEETVVLYLEKNDVKSLSLKHCQGQQKKQCAQLPFRIHVRLYFGWRATSTEQ